MTNIAPIQGILETEPAVTAICGDQIFQGLAGQAAKPPFLTWFTLGNVPFNTLAGRPSHDAQAFQVDAFSRDPAEAQALAFAARNALEAAGTIGRGPVDLGTEKDTGLSRWSLDVAFVWKREAA